LGQEVTQTWVSGEDPAFRTLLELGIKVVALHEARLDAEHKGPTEHAREVVLVDVGKLDEAVDFHAWMRRVTGGVISPSPTRYNHLVSFDDTPGETWETAILLACWMQRATTHRLLFAETASHREAGWDGKFDEVVVYHVWLRHVIGGVNPPREITVRSSSMTHRVRRGG
jgi:hypothetical protein